MLDRLLERFRQGDRLALSRLLSFLARGEESDEILARLDPSPRKPARVIALTGGAGVGTKTGGGAAGGGVGATVMVGADCMGNWMLTSGGGMNGGGGVASLGGGGGGLSAGGLISSMILVSSGGTTISTILRASPCIRA